MLDDLQSGLHRMVFRGFCSLFDLEIRKNGDFFGFIGFFFFSFLLELDREVLRLKLKKRKGKFLALWAFSN